MSNPIMHATNALHGSKATCFFTIDDRRMNFMHMTEFEAGWDVNTQNVPILGKVGYGHKSAGGNGTWTGTAHFNQSHLRVLIDHYQKTGEMPYFKIQVTNEDPNSNVGRQTVVYNDCLIGGKVILSKFQAGDELLTENLSGTFESFDIPERFRELEGL